MFDPSNRRDMKLILAALCACVGACGPRINRPAVCGAGFSAVALQEQARRSIVRIESEAGMGTGFIVGEADDSVTIATNYHVIRAGHRLEVVFDSGMRLGNIEVVKVDADRDLALLRARGGNGIAGLRLAVDGVALGERVGALGYPYVAGEDTPSLTFEDGSVSNTRTMLDGKVYIRSNANINPGNSGGPVINACGEVVGVVVSVHTETARTALIIPVSDLRSLVAAASDDRQPVESELAQRVQALETAVHYRRGDEVAAMFSRAAIDGVFKSLFFAYLQQTMALACDRVTAFLRFMDSKDEPVIIDSIKILTCEALPEADRVAIVAKVLQPDEATAVALAGLVLNEQVDTHTALVAWLGQYAHELFGSNVDLRIERLEPRGEDAVDMFLAVGASYWSLSWVYEWGDWRINEFRCERGCVD